MELSLQSLAAGLDTVWVLLAAAMVFFMEAGFAFLEAGFIRSKNSINVIMKVFIDCTVGILGYWAIGFALMYGLDASGIIGTSGFLLNGQGLLHINLRIPHEAFWLFQVAFCVAAASIVSGAVAERMKFTSYIIFTLIMTAVIYPVAGHWIWGNGGWLAALGMQDFAGSAAVHALGGWAALAAVIVLGPRHGKYGKDGKSEVISGHNLPLAAIGAFILWFGWFGFNAGSSLSGLDLRIASIAVTTNLAAAAGGVTASLLTKWLYHKVDPSMTINGVLAGLVAITAGTAYVSQPGAVLIGIVAGSLVVWAVPFFDARRADDPVGAIAVHGVCGTFGTLAVGLFAVDGGLLYGGGWHLLAVQGLGVGAVALWSFSLTFLTFQALKHTVGLRVSLEEELDGLDLSEHGMEAYGSDVRVYGTVDQSKGLGVPETFPIPTEPQVQE